MKFALIAINIVLVCFLAYGALQRFGERSAKVQTVSAVRRGSNNKKTVPPPVVKKETKTSEATDPAVTGAVVAAGNIFDSTRCENAQIPGRTAVKNDKLDFTLVGIFTIDDKQGAIILQKDKTLNSMQNRQTMTRGGMPGQPPGATGQTSTTASADENVVYKQYVRVGETLASGHMLVSVSRTGAVLEKGSEKLELVMTEASKNQPATTVTVTTSNNMSGSPYQNMTEEQRRAFREEMDRRRAERMQRDQGSANQPGGGPPQGGTAAQNTHSDRATSSSSGRGGRSR